MIELRDISLTRSGKPLLKGISLEIDSGGITGIIGRSGAGKTMLLKIISGKTRDYEGDILVDKRPLPSFSRRELPAAISSCFGIPPENADDALHHFLLLSRMPYKKYFHPFSEYDYQVAEEYIDSFGLEEYRNTALAALPGGELKKSLLAFAFIRTSDVLVLDEPSDGLDLHSRVLLQRALSRYTFSGDRTAVLASNDINFIAQTADRVIILDSGAVAMDIDPESIDAEVVKRYFNEDVLISRNIYNGKPEIHFFPGT